jgi:hypothetical protein
MLDTFRALCEVILNICGRSRRTSCLGCFTSETPNAKTWTLLCVCLRSVFAFVFHFANTLTFTPSPLTCLPISLTAEKDQTTLNHVSLDPN